MMWKKILLGFHISLVVSLIICFLTLTVVALQLKQPVLEKIKEVDALRQQAENALQKINSLNLDKINNIEAQLQKLNTFGGR